MSEVRRNVVYGMYSGLALLMDAHLPESSNGLGVVHVSGSGWSAPLDLDARPLKESGHVEIEGRPLVDAGYTLFTVNHRALPRFRFPAQIEDMQRAVRFVRHHAAEYRIDPSRIGAVGGSSGGHLVALLGVLDGEGDPTSESVIDRESARVQCVVARAAPTDFLHMPHSTSRGLLLGTDSLDSGDLDSEAHGKAVDASPAHRATADSAPMLLLHGDADDVVPFEQSVRMERALREADVPVKLIRIPGAGHGPGILRAEGQNVDYVREMVAWLDEHLGVV
ncbi:prolyl oligopeptidase family serine peptidase, partial [Candidatus Poribacteria bacterium]|nr:prolyl oligopeptidase family serine peptidase [Candidatus Poribacteria bacterium]